MRAKEIGKYKCPICNKGSLFMIYEYDGQSHLENIPSYIECGDCDTRFSEIVVKGKNIVAYTVEKLYKNYIKYM